MRRYFFVLVLALAVALIVTACGGSKENGGAEPGELEEETGDSGDVADEPVIIEGEWYFIEGEFHQFNDLSFITYFKEYEATYTYGEEVYYHTKYLGDDKVGGTKTRHFAFKVESPSMERPSEAELWFTETGELVQVGGRDEKGKFVTETDPDALEYLYSSSFFDHYCDPFVKGPEEVELAFGAIFTDPEELERAKTERGYVINGVSSQKRDLGAGKVTVVHYDFTTPSVSQCIYEIGKIGDKYLIVYYVEKYGGGDVELKVTKAVPFK